MASTKDTSLLEAVSTSDKRIESKELKKNEERYAGEKVAEYFTVYPKLGRQVSNLVGRRFDPTATPPYVPIPPDAEGRVYSKVLDVFFSIDPETEELVVVDATTGERFLISDEEEAARVEAERRLAEEEEARQKAEARAEQEAADRKMEAAARQKAEERAEQEAAEKKMEAAARQKAEERAEQETAEKKMEATARQKAEAEKKMETAARRKAEARAEQESQARLQALAEVERLKARLRQIQEGDQD